MECSLGPTLLAVFDRASACQISPSSTAEPSFSVLMDASEAFASFQRFVRQGEQDQYHVAYLVNGSMKKMSTFNTNENVE